MQTRNSRTYTQIEIKKKGDGEGGKLIFKVIGINNPYKLLSANLKCIYLFLSQTQNNRLNLLLMLCY